MRTAGAQYTDLRVDGVAGKSQFITYADGQVPEVEGEDGAPNDASVDIATPGYTLPGGRIRVRAINGGGGGGGASVVDNGDGTLTLS